MIRSKFFIIMLVLFLLPIGLYAGWDWPAGPGTSKSKVADVDNQNTGLGTPGQKIVYNPDNKRVQLVYIPNMVEYPNSRLMYAYSTDDGETFTSLGPIDNGAYARNTAIATDAKDVPYIVWCEFDGPPQAVDNQQTVAIYFARDVDFAAGLFESKLVSDPAQVDFTKYGYPSISVSPDGKHIVIAWSTVKPSATQLQPTGIQVVTSSDGGETFTAPKTVVAPMDLPSNKPILSEVANPTTVIGENGYVFCLFTVFCDSSDAYDRRPAFIESNDYGETWSAPTMVPMHPEGAHGHTWHSTFGPPILVDGEPHFAWVCKPGSSFPPGSVAVWHFGRKNGTWTATRVSPPYDEEDLFFENSNFCSIGKDADNNIYVCYLTTSIAAGYNWGFIGLHVSSDNGLTWNKYPLPMHDYMAREDRYFRSSLPNMAQRVGRDKLHVLGLQGGYWSGPVQAVWVFHADPREIAGYVAPPKEDFP